MYLEKLQLHTNLLKIWRSFIFILLAGIAFSSCSSSRHINKSEMRTLVRASIRLGFDIERKDNHALMIEASQWIGVPYRYGGSTKNGIDCSGLTSRIYKNVYKIDLSHNSQEQLDHDVIKKVKKHSLKQGDLVFFSSKKSKKRINHVGIYLKENNFLHASSSSGVRIDKLDDDYWKKRWITGGRIIGAKK